MKRPLNIKKLVLLNLPYILMGLFATNFGEAWRMAQGADASEKVLSLISVLPAALGSFWPSFHPLDLLVGLCCGAALRLAVYLKGKNAKKYRPNIEYGSLLATVCDTLSAAYGLLFSAGLSERRFSVPAPILGGVVSLTLRKKRLPQNHISFSRSFNCNRHLGSKKAGTSMCTDQYKRIDLSLAVFGFTMM